MYIWNWMNFVFDMFEYSLPIATQSPIFKRRTSSFTLRFVNQTPFCSHMTDIYEPALLVRKPWGYIAKNIFFLHIFCIFSSKKILSCRALVFWSSSYFGVPLICKHSGCVIITHEANTSQKSSGWVADAAFAESGSLIMICFRFMFTSRHRNVLRITGPTGKGNHPSLRMVPLTKRQ